MGSPAPVRADARRLPRARCFPRSRGRIGTLTFGVVGPGVALPVLAVWECGIGRGLITGRFMRLNLFLLFLQMSGTVLPLFFFPQETFAHAPYAATLEGQYVIKNLVLVSAGLVLSATLRGGMLVADPGVAKGSMDDTAAPMPLAASRPRV